MEVIIDERYGADADGNRGISKQFVVFENTPEERATIAKALFDKGVSSECTGSSTIKYDDGSVVVEELDIDDVYEYSFEIKMLEEEDDEK